MTTERRGSFGERLRRYRISAGLTQEALADRAGLSVRGIADLERGARRFPHFHTMRRLAEALELAPDVPLQRLVLPLGGDRDGRPPRVPAQGRPRGDVGFLDAEGITHYNGAPTVHIGLVNHPAAHRLEREVTVTTGGAPPSPTLLARMTALNLRPVHVYGLTETYAPYTVCESQEAWGALDDQARAHLLGRQGVHNIVSDPIRVVDGQMTDVPRDGATLGEVVMRGIISGGENISSIEVEHTICRHPAVLECAVIAIPDSRWGERPKAFVTLTDGARPSEREIIDFCRELIAHFKCPATVEFGPLPKTSTGKVQKFVLREREWARHGKRIN
jgi:fatty-acyl-CoA synthase